MHFDGQLVDRLETVKVDLEKVKIDLGTKLANAMADSADATRSSDQLRTTVERISEQNLNLRNELEKSQQRLFSYEEEAKQKLAALDRDIYEQKLELQSTTKQIRDYSKRLSESQDESQTLLTKSSDLEDKVRDMSELIGEIILKAGTDVNRLVEGNQKLQNTLREQNAILNRREIELIALKLTCEEKSTENDSLTESLKRQRILCSDLEMKNTNLKTQIQEANEEWTSTCLTLENDVMALRGELNAKEDRLAEVGNEIRGMKTEIVAMKGRNDKLRAQLKNKTVTFFGIKTNTKTNKKLQISHSDRI